MKEIQAKMKDFYQKKDESTQKGGKEENVPPHRNEAFEESVKILEAAGKAEKMIVASRVWQEKAQINKYCRKIFFPAFRDRVILIAKQLKKKKVTIEK